MKLSTLTPEFLLLLASALSPLQPGERDHLRAACGAVTQWSQFLALADRHQVAPIAYRNLQQSAPGLVPAETLGQLRDRAEHSQLQALALTREQNRVADWLSAEGLDLCPLKGPLLSQRLYGDIGWRATGDLDVLIPAAGMTSAARQLLAHGYTRTKPTVELASRPQKLYARLFHHLGYTHPERRINLELHHLIAEPYLIPPAITQQMLARAQRKTFVGTSLLHLTDEDTLAYLLIHGARHQWARLKWVGDIAALARQAESLDWAHVRRVLAEAGWLQAFGQGLLLANQLLRLPLPALAQEVIVNTPAVHGLAGDSVQALLEPQDYTSTPGRWHGLRHLFYLVQLNPDLHYRLPLLTTVQLNYTVWSYYSRSIAGRSG